MFDIKQLLKFAKKADKKEPVHCRVAFGFAGDNIENIINIAFPADIQQEIRNKIRVDYGNHYKLLSEAELQSRHERDFIFNVSIVHIKDKNNRQYRAWLVHAGHYIYSTDLLFGQKGLNMGHVLVVPTVNVKENEFYFNKNFKEIHLVSIVTYTDATKPDVSFYF